MDYIFVILLGYALARDDVGYIAQLWQHVELLIGFLALVMAFILAT